MAVIDNARLAGILIDEEEEGVAHHFHLVERLIDCHRHGLVHFLTDDDRRIAELLFAHLADLEVFG